MPTIPRESIHARSDASDGSTGSVRVGTKPAASSARAAISQSRARRLLRRASAATTGGSSGSCRVAVTALRA